MPGVSVVKQRRVVGKSQASPVARDFRELGGDRCHVLVRRLVQNLHWHFVDYFRLVVEGCEVGIGIDWTS